MLLHNKLAVYQKAFALNKHIYQLIKKSTAIPMYAKNQLGRSSLSIMLNIAEGNAKVNKKDRRNFFIIGRASAHETAALIDFLTSENEIPQDQSSTFLKEINDVSKMLYSMIKNLEQ